MVIRPVISSGIVAKNVEDRTKEELKLLESIDKESIFLKILSLKGKSTFKQTNGQSKSLLGFPPTGTRRLLVLLIDFTDRAFTIAVGNITNLMNQVNYNGTGSFRDYWLANSYNTLTVNSTLGGWYHASNNMAYYGANSGGHDVNPRLLVREAIDAAENAGIDFSLFDNDSDGNVDGVLVVHSGYGEEAGGGANTIWSHHWTLDTYQRTYDGVTIDDYAIVPELRDNFGNNIINIGVICHEFGHSLGLPDLYDTDFNSEGIGSWGLMGSGNWNNNGASPSILCAWSKVFLGYSNPQILASATNISVLNSAQNNILYRINTPHTNEYFLLENRQRVGFDIGLPGTGLAIWHINTSKTTSQHISDNDVNIDENLKGVDLEEADGLANLDNQINRGDNGDLYPGVSCNHIFNDNSNPNSKTYSPIVNTNKPVTDIIETDGILTFSFMGRNPITLTGPGLICTSPNSTFVINYVPSGTTINWTNGGNLDVVGGQGTNQYVVRAFPNSSFSNWIRSTITTSGSSCLHLLPICP